MVKEMIKQEIRKPKVQKRHRTIRVKLAGTTEFPRLAVYRSTKHIYAQLIDDEKNVTVCSASSVDKLNSFVIKDFLEIPHNIGLFNVLNSPILFSISKFVTSRTKFIKKEENSLENFYINRFGKKLYINFALYIPP